METREMVRGICYATVPGINATDPGKDFYLLIKAVNWGGYWENPGGRIDEGETKVGALTREIFQETGQVAQRIFLGSKDFTEYDNLREGEMIHSNVYSYGVQIPYTLDIVLSKEEGHTDFCWASYDDAMFRLSRFREQKEIFRKVVESTEKIRGLRG